jgi:Protein similar to CwfJ C-terminus 1
MSLLKGIVFIPREKKPESATTVEEQNHDKKRKSKDHKKSKSSEVKSHKKHRRDNEKSSKKSKEGRDSSSDDDDHTDFSKYEKEINQMAARDSDVDDTRSSHTSKRDETRDYESNQPSKGGDSKPKKSSFSSLIGSLQSKTAPQAESNSRNSPDNSKKITLHGNNNTSDANGQISDRMSAEIFQSENMQRERSKHQEYSEHSERSERSAEVLSESSTRSAINNEIPRNQINENPPVKEKSMNQSVAEQFRAKLKAKNSFQTESRSLTQLIEDEEREDDNNQLFENSESMRAQVINKVRKDIVKNNNRQSENGNEKNSSSSKSVEMDQKNTRKEFSNQRSDINKLMQSEKFGQNDMDENFRENVLRLGERYKGSELGKMGAFGNGDLTGQDEEEEIDMKMFENKFEVDNDSSNKKSKKQILKKIGNDNRRENNNENEKLDSKQREILNRCPHCCDSSNFKKHLTVSKGEHTILRLKAGSNVLGPMHCIVTPITHTASFVKCEDEVEVEVTRYKSCLQRMFERNGQSVLFLESALGFSKHPHACIDVVPIPKGMEGEARMSFREVRTRTCMSTSR